MIALLSNGVFPCFEDSVFSLRQEAYFNAYGAHTPFFMLWVQKNENGDISAVITSLSGDITLSLSEKSDFDEIRSFLFTVGFSSVFFNAEYSEKLGFGNIVKGKIMRLEKEIDSPLPDFREPDYKAVFELVFNEGEASFGDWFTDLSHKIRRGAADIVTKTVGEKVVACALCVAKTDRGALIGSVKTDEQYRNRGFGTELVKGLCAYLQKDGRQIYLCREEDKNESFYSGLGFENCGEWMIYKK